MGTELSLQTGTLYAFLLVLARISGAFVFLPLPGIKVGPDIARLVLSVSVALTLFPSWPVIDASQVTLGVLIGWILAEAGIGIAVGLAVAFFTEGFQMGAQMVSLQAGLSFASTVDPTSGADSPVLLTIAQMSAGLLFFATGMDRQVLFSFAHSLATQPPGRFNVSESMMNAVIRLGGTIFTTGLRLVLPVMGLLLMVEISIALMGRLNSQLHLMALSMPIKLLLALVLLAWLVAVFPRVFERSSGDVLRLIQGLLSS
jgi:flagellar biosynthetic protein FliR